ncbi:MAG: HD domain-containing protein, partial [Chthonomonadales bacterium]
VRDRSILKLARTCNFDEDHAKHIARLCLKLFDELRRLGLHPYGARERDLLRYGAYVHDIGGFLSHSNHQRHAYYLVRHSDLLGFNDTEINVIANIALYHRKSIPKKKHENLADLSRASRKLVETLSAIMRVAEGLDRSHLALVEDVHLEKFEEPMRMRLTIVSPADCQLELWGVESGKDLWESMFGMPMETVVVSPTKKPTTRKKVTA